MIKIRITLESKEDVIRELIIDSENNLEYLHHIIIKNLNLDEFEMASFYLTDSNLNLGKEIPLFDTSEKGGEVITMNNISISSVLNSEDSKLIYIYDFMNMWRFFIEFLEFSEITTEQCTNEVGEMPKKAPDLEFETEVEKDLSTYKEDFEDFNEYEY